MANPSGYDPYGERTQHQIQTCLMENFKRLQASEFNPSPTDSELYRIQSSFAHPDQYWREKAWSERFEDSLTSGMLYRPAIVSELVKEVENALKANIGRGIMIKGPQGIGKSHSIVNLIHKLLYRSKGKYLVTFIPDCHHWEDVGNLYDAICQSLGSTKEELNIQMSEYEYGDRRKLRRLIEIIDSVLAEQGRQWIFFLTRSITFLVAQII